MKSLIILLLYFAKGYKRLPNRLISLSSPFKLLSSSSSSSITQNEYIGQTSIKITSFNILAPCYHKVDKGKDGSTIMEAEYKDKYMKRNNIICDELLATNSDVICLQEFWCASEDIKQLYKEKFASYTLKELPRTSHWRSREDGLAVLVKEAKVVLQDYRNILFHDCGDRIAQLLLLAIKPVDSSGNLLPNIPYQQLICVNTHLLFPHNEYSTKIRLREVTKILGFIESYRQINLCTTICGRSDVRIPIVITGDFNGSPKGQVHNYIRSQNYKSAIEQIGPSESWISHRSHLKKNVAVDHVFYLNPSLQDEKSLSNVPVPNWMNLVYNELMEKIVKEYGALSMREIFSTFNQDENTFITKDEFRKALNALGFIGENLPSLTDDEINILIDSADVNGDGTIDYKEFYDRFWQASNNDEQLDIAIKKQKSLSINAFSKSKWLQLSTSSSQDEPVFMSKYLENVNPLGDIEVEEFQLYPPELSDGVWPLNYTLSDHGIVTTSFKCNMLPNDLEQSFINPNPIAQKNK